MYVDANIFVFALTDSGAKSRAALALFERIERGELKAITTPLVFDEAIWILRKQKQPLAFIAEVVCEFYEFANLEIKDVPAVVPLHALEIMRQHNLKPRDAFHAAIMGHFGIKEIATDDKDFDRIPGIKRIRI